MIIFGFSRMLTEISDCLQATAGKMTRLVVNIPGQKHAAAGDLSEKLRGLNEWPYITALDDFVPEEGEEYFVVPDIPKPWVLVDFLKKTHELRFSRLIHPKAHVSPLARIGQGVFIGAGCIIGPGAVLKDHVFVNAGTIVGQDTVVHEHARLNMRSTIGGRVQIHANALVGPGATLIEDVVIGTGAVIAAGAVVTRDVKEKEPLARAPVRPGNARLNAELQPRVY